MNLRAQASDADYYIVIIHLTGGEMCSCGAIGVESSVGGGSGRERSVLRYRGEHEVSEV